MNLYVVQCKAQKTGVHADARLARSGCRLWTVTKRRGKGFKKGTGFKGTSRR